MEEIGGRTAMKETVKKISVALPLEMLGFDVQIRHKSHGYGYV